MRSGLTMCKMPEKRRNDKDQSTRSNGRITGGWPQQQIVHAFSQSLAASWQHVGSLVCGQAVDNS